MACKTCDHTRHNVCITNDDGRVWWCPRCGSLTIETGRVEPNEFIPALPGRVRAFLFDSGPGLANSMLSARQKQVAWATGLYEACMVNPEFPGAKAESEKDQ